MNATRCFCGSWTWISTFSDQDVTFFLSTKTVCLRWIFMTSHHSLILSPCFQLQALSHWALQTLQLDPIGPGTKSQQLSRSWSYSPGSLSAFRSIWLRFRSIHNDCAYFNLLLLFDWSFLITIYAFLFFKVVCHFVRGRKSIEIEACIIYYYIIRILIYYYVYIYYIILPFRSVLH